MFSFALFLLSSSTWFLAVASTYDACNKPSPLQTKSAIVRMDVLGNPDLVTPDTLESMAKKFTNAYNNLAVSKCDLSYRKILRSDFAIYKRPKKIKNVDDQKPFSFIVHIEYNCYGSLCDEENILFSQEKGFFAFRRLHEEHQRNRRVLAIGTEDATPAVEDVPVVDEDGDPVVDEDVCTCQGNNPSYTAPTVKKMRRRMRKKTDNWAGVNRVQNILEVEPRDCSEYKAFKSSFTVEVEGGATEAELDVLGGMFTNAFNYYEEVTCSPAGFMEIESTEYVPASTRRRRTQFSLRFSFHLDGKCYGCGTGGRDTLFDDASQRVRRLELPDGRTAIARPGPVRQLQQKKITTSSPELCFCAAREGGRPFVLEDQPPFTESFLFVVSEETDIFANGIDNIVAEVVEEVVFEDDTGVRR